MKKPITLSRYLASIVFSFAGLLLAVGFFSVWSLNVTVQRSFAEMNALSAALVSSRLEEFFTRSRAALSRLELVLAQPEFYPVDHWQAYLTDALAEFPFLDKIEIVAPNARVVANAPAEPDRIGISRAGERVYEAVRAAAAPYWSDSYISLKNSQPAVTFGTKVGSWVILLDLNLEWFGAFAADIRTGSDRNVEIRLTDRNGVLLYHPDGAYVRQRQRQVDFPYIKDHLTQRSSLRIVDARQSWLVSARKLTEPDWYVLVLYPRALFIASLHKVLLGLFLLSLLTVLLGLAFWRIRLRRVRQAFAAITSEAQRIAAGDYGQLESFGEGFTEFQRVGESLNRMVLAVRSREETLRDRERGFREILEAIELVAVTLDAQGILRFVNPFAMSRLGYAEAELTGRYFSEYLCGESAICPFEQVLIGATPSAYVRSALKVKDGGELIVDWSIVRNLDAEGKLAGATGIGHDMTEIIHAQDRIVASLKEKEILLREVHHRVKNNLQIITSLLSLQQAENLDFRVVDALQEAANRIHSISLVHELLYASGDFGDLDFRSYAESLTGHLLSQRTGPHVDYHFHFDQFPLSLTDAVPCGLILNEAVTNSLKHAFPSPESGEPRIDFSGGIAAEGEVRIVIRDNGIGIDGEYAAAEGQHLGLTIMRVLAEQLGGALRVYAESGTVVELVFKPKVQSSL